MNQQSYTALHQSQKINKSKRVESLVNISFPVKRPQFLTKIFIGLLKDSQKVISLLQRTVNKDVLPTKLDTNMITQDFKCVSQENVSSNPSKICVLPEQSSGSVKLPLVPSQYARKAGQGSERVRLHIDVLLHYTGRSHQNAVEMSKCITRAIAQITSQQTYYNNFDPPTQLISTKDRNGQGLRKLDKAHHNKQSQERKSKYYNDIITSPKEKPIELSQEPRIASNINEGHEKPVEVAQLRGKGMKSIDLIRQSMVKPAPYDVKLSNTTRIKKFNEKTNEVQPGIKRKRGRPRKNLNELNPQMRKILKSSSSFKHNSSFNNFSTRPQSEKQDSEDHALLSKEPIQPISMDSSVSVTEVDSHHPLHQILESNHQFKSPVTPQQSHYRVVDEIVDNLDEHGEPDIKLYNAQEATLISPFTGGMSFPGYNDFQTTYQPSEHRTTSLYQQPLLSNDLSTYNQFLNLPRRDSSFSNLQLSSGLQPYLEPNMFYCSNSTSRDRNYLLSPLPKRLSTETQLEQIIGHQTL